MTVSIVVPAYNAEKHLDGILGRLSKEKTAQTELIVVDDGSTDRTAGIAAGYPVRCITQENAGPAAARNAGWKASKGDIVVFIDSDCLPLEGWPETLLDGFVSDDIAAVAGSYEISNPEGLLARLIHEEIKQRHKGYGDTVRFFGTYNVAVRRELLEKTGGFDESFRRASGEDNDLSYRITKLGGKIAYAPKALVAHHHTNSLPKYLKEQYTHGYWRMKLYSKHPDMAGGDDYTGIKDVIEPPLALLTMLSLATVTYIPLLFTVFSALMVAIQLPAAVRTAMASSNPTLLLLAPLTFLRGYARGLGMALGFARFFVGGKA